ncbi:serine protease [Altererythrobacter sp. Root672]|uniref:serine protease n=1 Tax=Altererythrobacter sp. Root672 TaxID=1736584 RepID=UPI0006FDCEE7|nr:serine protease [Altererythrobacter sp. Root672]KRA84474.1 hypothetical protein ASD76_11015 [Altererythrobacter sp. Root672]
MNLRFAQAVLPAVLLSGALAGCEKAPEPAAPKAVANADLKETCDARRAKAEGGGRIVGGEPAKPGSAPWQAEILSSPKYTAADRAYDEKLADGDECKIYLKERQGYELSHKCGGSYIGDGFVITAAHCVDNIPSFDGKPGNVLTDRNVRLGTQNLSVSDGIFPIDSVVIHQGYTKQTMLDDIALIKLKDDKRLAAFQDAGRLAPVSLMQPTSRDFDKLELLRVTGWGWMGQRGEKDTVGRLDSSGRLQRNPADLQQVSLNYLTDAPCKEEYGASFGPGSLCAGSLGPDGKVMAGKDSCQGDSGGPLTRQEDGGKRSLVGIVSAGKGCGAGKPALYTRVSHYADWIAEAKRAAKPGQVVRLPGSAS